MYGDTAELAREATRLRELASDTRDRSIRLVASIGSAWVSPTAVKYADDLADRARDFTTAADSLEAAARAIDAHIASVAAVKQAIVEAEHWVADRWNDAVRLVGNVVEVAQEGVARVFHFFGQEVPDFLVHQAKDIVHSIPALPVPGSHEWLELSDTFRRRGW